MTPILKAGTTTRKDCGFTLIELMMVILLIGIMYFVVVPRVAPTILNLQLSASAKRIANELRYLHNACILRKESFAFFVNMDTGEYWVERIQFEETDNTDGSISSSFSSDFSSSFDADAENRTVPLLKIPDPLAHSPFSQGSAAHSSSGLGSQTLDVDLQEDDSESSGPFLDSTLLSHHKLEGGVRFEGIELVESGQSLDGEVEVDLSPRGFMESGLIRLIDDDEEEMTIFINSVTGEIKLYEGHLELEDFGL